MTRRRRRQKRRRRRDDDDDDDDDDDEMMVYTCEEERREAELLDGVVTGEGDAQSVALWRHRLRRLSAAVGAVQSRVLVEAAAYLHRVVLAVLLSQ